MNREEHLSKTLDLTQAAMEQPDAEVIEITPDTDFPEIDKQTILDQKAEIKKLEAFICKMADGCDYDYDYDEVASELMTDDDFEYWELPDKSGRHSRGSDGWNDCVRDAWDSKIDDAEKAEYIMAHWEDN